METECAFSFIKLGHIISVRAAHGYVLVILDQTYPRMQVLQEFSRIGFDYKVDVIQIPPLKCTAVFFPGSPIVTQERIMNFDFFNWK